MARRDIIVAGASAGGVEALRTLVGAFPPDLPAAVFVVLHMTPDSPSMIPTILERAGPLPVRVPHDPLEIQHGQIYVPAPDHHLMLEPGTVRLSRGPRQNRTRPAIDPLFRSAADAYGSRVIGVVLTGTLDDGTAGLKAIKHCGGVAVVQDPEDAMFPGMPKSAIAHVAVDHVLPLAQIGRLVRSLVGQDAPPDGCPSANLHQETVLRAQGDAARVREILSAGAAPAPVEDEP
jgi:two-component system, chemotaxis family, protein-glutamate methylesterase/glutaminase